MEDFKKYKLEGVTRDILRQGFLSILDVSVNELNVKMLNNSLTPLETFYLQIEEMLINHTKKFLKKLFENYSTKVFVFVSGMYCENITEAIIKRTQRRINYYVTDWVKHTLELKMLKNYIKFIYNRDMSIGSKSRRASQEEVKEMDIERSPKKPNSKDLKMAFKRSSTKEAVFNNDYDSLIPSEK